MSTQATHADRVAEHARARALAPAHASPWRLTVDGKAIGELVTVEVSAAPAKSKRRSKAQRQTRLDLVDRTVETPGGPVTLTEEQVDAMTDDEATAVLASAKAQEAEEGSSK